MKYINNQMVLEINSIGNWTVDEVSHSGAIVWSHPQSDTVVYATPNWENENGICPIEIEDGEDYNEVTSIQLEGHLLNQLEVYKAVLSTVLSNIVNN
jgi:hypothetical protein